MGNLSLTFLISAVFDLLPLVISGNVGHTLAVIGLRVMALRLARCRGLLCCAESKAEFAYFKRELGLTNFWTYSDFPYLEPFYLFCVKFDWRKISEACGRAEISGFFGFDACCAERCGCGSPAKLKSGETSGIQARVLRIAKKCCSKTSIAFFILVKILILIADVEQVLLNSV